MLETWFFKGSKFLEQINISENPILDLSQKEKGRFVLVSHSRNV
jgi:hypothetical protein